MKKKICVLGNFAVGKTSLIERFVYSVFSERYLTTVGVKIDRKNLVVEGQELTLLIWDLEGRSQFYHMRSSYLAGMAGYLLVADGTRERSLAEALEIRATVDEQMPGVPYVLLVNKVDLQREWIVREDELRRLEESGVVIFRTSAKTGLNVDAAFAALAGKLVEGHANG